MPNTSYLRLVDGSETNVKKHMNRPYFV